MSVSSNPEVKLVTMIFKVFNVCLIFLVLFQVANGNPKNQNKYLEQENSCRDVCSLCDCDGFYCEDECICECKIEEEENLQCIADMKKECDKNGLEYEILLQDSAKERFLRQVSTHPNPNSFSDFDFSKNFVIMKHKREPAPLPEPEPNPQFPTADPLNPISSAGADPTQSPVLGMPLKVAGLAGAGAARAAITGARANMALRGFAARTAMANPALFARPNLMLGSPMNPLLRPGWPALNINPPLLGLAKSNDTTPEDSSTPSSSPPSFSSLPVQPPGTY